MYRLPHSADITTKRTVHNLCDTRKQRMSVLCRVFQGMLIPVGSSICRRRAEGASRSPRRLHSLAVCRVSPPTTHTRHAGSLSTCQMDPQRHTLVARLATRLATRLDTHLATHVPRRRRMLYTTPDLGQSPWRPRASPAGARHGAMAAACTPCRPQVLGTALRPCRPPSCARAHSCARAGRSSRRSASLPWHAWRHRVRAC